MQKRLFQNNLCNTASVRKHLGTGGRATEQMSDVGRLTQGPMRDENREGGRVNGVRLRRMQADEGE